MSKCGKFIPECEYFGTGGCISPFNCPYKMESEYSNSATSVPEYVHRGSSMTDKEIERCLERFTIGKTTDVMNFDYAGTLAYLQRLKTENDSLREDLKEALKLVREAGELAEINNRAIEALQAENAALRERIENAVERLKAREQSVCLGWEWKGVVTDKDIDEVFGVKE